MTRGQYIAMCLIGGVAIVAYLESQRVAAVLVMMMQGGNAPSPSLYGV